MLVEHRVLFFTFVPNPPLSREQQAEAMVKALPHIKRMVASRNAADGIIARIRSDGHVARHKYDR